MVEEDDAPFDEDTLTRMRPPPLARKARLVSGIARSDFARTYGLPESLLEQLERGELEPEPGMAAYLRAILGDPVAVAAAYGKSVAGRSAAE